MIANIQKDKSMDESLDSFFYLPERDQSFSKDKCFLCGADLNDALSVEHVFPKWLQKEFDLWNQKITLLNGTIIPYKSLTIPCCEKCNNEYLSAIERKVSNAYQGGIEAFKKLDEYTIFLWISKIFYGILFKELFLPFDRRQPSADTILSPDLLEKYRMAHLLLQGIRLPMKFIERNPWSLFVFESQKHTNQNLNFDYKDCIQGLTFGIRMGEISIIAVLQDNSAQAEIFQETIERLQQLKLHPIQFGEIFAKIKYKQLTLNRTPKYLITQMKDSQDITIDPLHLEGMCPEKIYNDWNEEVYSHILAFSTGIPKEELYVEEVGRTVTYLYNDENGLNHIPIEEG